MSRDLSRRQALAGLGMASAAAVVPVAGLNIAKAMNIGDRSAWDAALAKYRAADAEYDRRIDAEEEAGAAVERAVPRIARYFDDYRLGMGMKRDDVEFWLRSYVTRTGNKIDVAATADEFMDYNRRSEEARKLHGVKRWAEQVRAYYPHYQAAREKLMSIPAPDHAALLVKLEVAFMIGTDDAEESVLADAQRLLTTGRA